MRKTRNEKRMKKLIEQILKFGVVGVVCFLIDEEMSLPEVCTDVARLQTLSEEKAAVEEELLMKMEEWEALSE